MNKKISIIVPIYNINKKLIKRAVDSVINQSYRNFELLIIDDGSSSEIASFCDSITTNDSRISVYHIPNGGVSRARNFGLDKSSGDYITFLDGDDFLSPQYLEHLIEAMFQTNASYIKSSAKRIYTEESLSLNSADATSIGQTFATIGLLGGILGGVTMINIGARRGDTAIIESVEDLQKEMLTGLVQKNDRSEFGQNTVNAMLIDTLTWHFSLILVAVGMAYGMNAVLKVLLPSVSFPVYGLALVCSIVLQGALKLVNLDEYVDKKIITHIGSSATDYLVAFGVASININVVMKYLAPIIVFSVIGFIFVVAWFWIVSPRFLVQS